MTKVTTRSREQSRSETVIVAASQLLPVGGVVRHSDSEARRKKKTE